MDIKYCGNTYNLSTKCQRLLERSTYMESQIVILQIHLDERQSRCPFMCTISKQEKVPLKVSNHKKTTWNKNSARSKISAICSSLSVQSILTQPFFFFFLQLSVFQHEPVFLTSPASRRETERNARLRGADFQCTLLSSCQNQLTGKLQPERWHWCGEERAPAARLWARLAWKPAWLRVWW